MSLFNQISAPAAGASVFQPMTCEWAWNPLEFSMVAAEASAAMDTGETGVLDLLEAGDEIRILNGTYAGTFTVIEITPGPGGLGALIVLNTPFTGSSLTTGSNRFIPEGPADFEIISGYQAGPEAAIKPWKITSALRVSAASDGVFRFDISGYLRKEYRATAPLAGPHVNISLRYLVRPKTAAALPADTAAVPAYYGLAALNAGQLAGTEALGERPVLFFGGAPTLYSLARAKGIVNNYLADPAGAPQITGAPVVDLQLLSCEARELVWQHVAPTTGFTTDPALPSWIQATAVGSSIAIIINPCTAGVGDYLAADYNPLDYLTSGQINSVTGCYSFDFALGGDPLFTLNVCVAPISEILEVCPADVFNFAWLNSRGGFSSFALECRAIYGRDFGGETTVVDAARVLKRTEYRDVYDTVEVRAGVLSRTQLDMLTDLRSAVQAFLRNPETGQFDLPIVIDRQSFKTYENRFNQSETRVNFTFKFSAQIRTQTQ